jgi:hypothetical protein
MWPPFSLGLYLWVDGVQQALPHVWQGDVCPDFSTHCLSPPLQFACRLRRLGASWPKSAWVLISLDLLHICSMSFTGKQNFSKCCKELGVHYRLELHNRSTVCRDLLTYWESARVRQISAKSDLCLEICSCLPSIDVCECMICQF